MPVVAVAAPAAVVVAPAVAVAASVDQLGIDLEPNPPIQHTDLPVEHKSSRKKLQGKTPANIFVFLTNFHSRAQSAEKLTLQSARFSQNRSLLGGEILGHSGDIIIGYSSGDTLHDCVFAQQGVKVP